MDPVTSFSRKCIACNVRAQCDAIPCDDDRINISSQNVYKMEEQMNTKKIKYWIMKSQTWKPENFCAGINSERNATHNGFIHFEIRIKWNDLFIRIALHDADFGWVYHLRLLRIEFNNNNLAATRGGGTWTLRFVHTTHSHNSVLIEFNIQY